MKRFLISLLILCLLTAIPLAACGCKRKNPNIKNYDPSEYTESIDLSQYTLVLEDEFEGELDRTLWGDTRQGTRRDGFWTKNLAYTDGEGHLIIRTETRGSRWCSDTFQRNVTGYNESNVILTYDDCYPFGMIAGDFGDISSLTAHTSDLVGYVIKDTFDLLAGSFDAFTAHLEIPTDGMKQTITAQGETLNAYASFFETAAKLYNYYSFVPAIKNTVTPLEKSATVGINYPLSTIFGVDNAQSVNYQSALARLYGFTSEEAFVTCAQALADTYRSYAVDLKKGSQPIEALENGCFHTENDSFVFPIALRNESAFLLTYVIVDAVGRVSIWVNDVPALLRAINYDASTYSGGTVNNETYCKNILFVTGPKGVYSGALRTMDTFTHGFGYYEIRCKLPAVEGIWHAFWLMCGDVYSVENGSADGVEIDVFEYLPARDTINCALHWDGYDEAHKNVYRRLEGVGFQDDIFHTFGMNWDETGYTFYIDGKKVWHTMGDGVCPEPGYMKISTEYGEWGDWVGELDEGDLAVDWVIDYVRVYEKK